MITSFRWSVKFIYSEKATNFFEIFTLLLTLCTLVKSKVKISQNLVAFSEYMNFKFSLVLIIEQQTWVNSFEIRIKHHPTNISFNSFEIIRFRGLDSLKLDSYRHLMYLVVKSEN